MTKIISSNVNSALQPKGITCRNQMFIQFGNYTQYLEVPLPTTITSQIAQVL